MYTHTHSQKCPWHSVTVHICLIYLPHIHTRIHTCINFYRLRKCAPSFSLCLAHSQCVCDVQQMRIFEINLITFYLPTFSQASGRGKCPNINQLYYASCSVKSVAYFLAVKIISCSIFSEIRKLFYIVISHFLRNLLSF